VRLIVVSIYVGFEVLLSTKVVNCISASWELSLIDVCV
jgi:hypothetical protein